MNNKATGEFILTRRKELGMTQIQLAEKLSVTDKAVSKWENGKSAPDISSLLPLSDALEVSVVEILNGERLEEKEVQEKSNITIIETMQKSRRKLFIGIVSVVILVLFMISLYPLHQFCTTVSIEDKAGIEIMANDYFSHFDKNSYLKLVQYEQKGDYLAALMQHENGIALVVFEKNHLFSDRYSPSSGKGPACEFGEVALHCFGENGLTVNVFFGVNISDEFREYSFRYRNVKKY